MLKRIIIVIIVLVSVGYITYASAIFSDNSLGVTCNELEIDIMDADGKNYIKEDEIKQLLERSGTKLKGRKVGKINFEKVESIVEEHSMIERAEGFASPSGKVVIKVWQHLPVLRIMSDDGSFYVDSKGKKTGLSLHSAANVVIASGNINDSITIRDLYRMALILQEEPAWDALVEQIYVDNNGDWIIIPRIGDFEIIFGNPVNIETKMKRLNSFIRDYIPKLGWERYSMINLKYDNQIVCIKKDISDVNN